MAYRLTAEQRTRVINAHARELRRVHGMRKADARKYAEMVLDDEKDGCVFPMRGQRWRSTNSASLVPPEVTIKSVDSHYVWSKDGGRYDRYYLESRYELVGWGEAS